MINHKLNQQFIYKKFIFLFDHNQQSIQLRRPHVTEPANASAVAHWLQIQQQYLEMWLSLAQQLLETTTPSTKTNQSPSPWSEMLELYWQTLGPSFTPEVRTIVRKFIDQSKNFSQFNNALLEAVQKTENSDQPAPWLNAWNANFNDVYNNFSKFLLESDNSLNIWQSLHNNGWRMMMFNMPFLSSLNSTTLSGGMQENLEKLLSMPTLGYTLEWQTKWQEGLKHWQAFQIAQQEYSEILNKISLRSIELLRKKSTELVGEHETTSSSPKTMREIYDLWVECGEEAYAEFVGTEEYAQANANLINTLMACKRYEQQMTDSWLSLLNMPTRKELDTFSLRMQQMRRELKILQTKQATNEIDILTCQINGLRAELEMLKAAKTNSTSAATTVMTKPAAIPAKPVPASKSATTPKKTTKKTIATLPDSASHSTSSTSATASMPTPPATSDKQGE